MMAIIENEIAHLLLGMARGNEWRRYVKRTIEHTEMHYGERVAGRVRAQVNEAIAKETAQRKAKKR